jgi:cystathionine gamma-lyase
VPYTECDWLVETNNVKDVLMGAIAFNSPKLKSELSLLQNAMGSVPSPFDCWLAHRGIKTLHVRVRASSETARKLAVALEASPHVVAVIYPGLISHPQHSVAAKQHRESLGGGMIAFRIRGGGEAAERFCEWSRYFALAESLGGVESLCEIPARMTHTAIAEEERQRMGIYQDLIRLSVGLEDAEDLLKDVSNTLAKVAGFVASRDIGKGEIGMT